MRAGDDPGAVFDALHAGGHIAVHGSEVERRDALADHLAATRLDGGRTAIVVVDTRDHAATLNSAIRDRLVAAGAVDDRRVAVTRDGQRLGAGDVIVTRRNDHDLGVANREAWTVTRVHRDGRLTVDDAERGRRELPADYVRETRRARLRGHRLRRARRHHHRGASRADRDHHRGRRLRGDDPRPCSLTPRTWSPPTSMTPGSSGSPRSAGTGPTSDPPPPAKPPPAPRPATARHAPLSEVLADLRSAWTDQLTAHRHLERLEERLEHVQAQAAWEAHCQQVLAPFETAREAAGTALERADQAATGCAAVLTERAEHHAAALRQTWDAD